MTSCQEKTRRSRGYLISFTSKFETELTATAACMTWPWGSRVSRSYWLYRHRVNTLPLPAHHCTVASRVASDGLAFDVRRHGGRLVANSLAPRAPRAPGCYQSWWFIDISRQTATRTACSRASYPELGSTLIFFLFRFTQHTRAHARAHPH